jgi:hypothetical protein
LIGGEIPVGQTEAKDEKVEVAEVLVFLIVECLQRCGLVGLERGEGAIAGEPGWSCPLSFPRNLPSPSSAF